ncbi:MAG: hypothetical protein J6T00_03275 [Bacteroidaceae bacterium]|nr:hypothetical protein [Bacteroidaceae bacterium]
MSKKNNHRRDVSVESEKPPLAQKATQESQKEKKTINITKGASLCIAIVVTVVIVVLGAYYLVVRNSDMLYMAQSKDWFTSDPSFIGVCMHNPGGFLAWAGSFLTQFFYYPQWGSAIMIGIWIVSIWMSKLVFRVKMAWMAVLSIPIVCLLVSTIDTGYWLYYNKMTGYWFYGTVGYFICILLVLFNAAFKKKSDRIFTTILVSCTYPFFGWYTLLALVYVAMLNISRMKKDDSLFGKIMLPAIPLVLASVVPPLFYNLYSGVRIEDVWTTGFPIFANGDMVSFTPSIPFIVMAAVPLLFPFLPKKVENSTGMTWTVSLVTIVVLVLSWLWVEKKDFQNYNYHAEMRMYRAAEEQDWDKVLEEMSNIPGDASRQMVILKNIALMNKGEMGTKMFKYNNMGEPPTNGFDTLRVHMVQTAAPLIYYYHGKTNFALRWSIENCVEFDYDYDNLKLLTRCALLGGEMEMAKRYLELLKTTLFYRDWAERLMPITENPELIKKYHEFDYVRELRDHMGTVLDGDNGLCEMYLITYFSQTMNKDSKALQEVTLDYALIQKDIQMFWPRFFLYAQLHAGEHMPIHYQEAAILYGNLEPESADISSMPFDDEVRKSYEGFHDMSQSLLQAGLSAEDVGEAMKTTYGHTFYWFYFFCRDVHSY